MDKKTAGLLGAIAGLATLNSAQAATGPAPHPWEALQASSYADLLAPIPNAVALLKADDAARAQIPVAEALDGVQVAQGYYYNPYYSQPYYSQPYYSQPYYRHHSYYRSYGHHHHHHHHHHHND